ncbi:MAG: large-conductance mechanosensitive channel protein MscL [Actinomycetes bacterium]|nr:large-conductance mechanosensitive channel protein MscL [Actinomycetes bacterium]
MKAFITEFKEFIARGSVIDLAVGVIIGGAFTTIVNSLVGDVLMPLVGWIVGGKSMAAYTLPLPAIAGHSQPVQLAWGAFVQHIINFLLVALVIFLLVKGINTLQRNQSDDDTTATEPSDEVKLLTEIRDSLHR